MVQQLQGEALVVHVFVVADGPDKAADHAYLHAIFQRCADRFGMTGKLADLPIDPDLAVGTGLLAGRKNPQPAGLPHVQEALLRRVHDAFCLTVMREPANASWATLKGEWEGATADLRPSDGVLGTAWVFLARVVDPGPPLPTALANTVKGRLSNDPAVTGPWWERGVQGPLGFAVWEAPAPVDRRALRSIVVVAPEDADDALSGWTWVVEGLELPRFGRYLLNAAKLRYQLRVWERENPKLRQARRDADAIVELLLGQVVETAEPSTTELVQASRDVAGLQRGEVGLARSAARLREMRRTVQIATANLTDLGGLGTRGLFADDRELGAWLSQQLEDDEVYLTAAQERAEQVATLTDQLVRRRLQEDQERLQSRQDRFNLGLAGIIGAILMMLTAIQSLMYRPPLPPLVVPAVVAALGALALLTSLLVLRAAVPRQWWSQVLVWLGSGLLGAAAAWVVVSAVIAAPNDESTTRFWAAIGFAVGLLAAALASAVRKIRSDE